MHKCLFVQYIPADLKHCDHNSGAAVWNQFEPFISMQVVKVLQMKNEFTLMVRSHLSFLSS